MNTEDINRHKIFLKYQHKQNHTSCIAILKEDGLMIRDVRKQTPLLRKVAVKQNGLALEFVREKDLETCIIAVTQNEKAKKFVPEELIKDVDWYIAYAEYPYIIQSVIRGFYTMTSWFR